MTARPSLVATVLLLAGSVGLAGCGPKDRPGPAPASPRERVNRAVDAGVRFLLGRQSPDGSWRTDTYGHFKGGDALTPLVVHTLLALPPDADRARACDRGLAYLAALARPGDQEINYPVYTAALAVLALGHPGQARHRPARDAWLRYLRRRQLTEATGWDPSDPEYGGWGFAADLPHRPGPGEPASPLTESNLSATVFAVEALRAAGCGPGDPALRKALAFVCRCQNYEADPARRQPRFDDGGFFFVQHDAERNKAGGAGRDRTGRPRYFSYGSTTADGLRCLLACGLPREDGRVRAARRWLEENFSAREHPGAFAAECAPRRPAVYYYYCASVARALRALEVREVKTPAGPVEWASALAEELTGRQGADGSWVNPAGAVREDDPVVSTALALSALVVCRGGPADRP